MKKTLGYLFICSLLLNCGPSNLKEGDEFTINGEKISYKVANREDASETSCKSAGALLKAAGGSPGSVDNCKTAIKNDSSKCSDDDLKNYPKFVKCSEDEGVVEPLKKQVSGTATQEDRTKIDEIVKKCNEKFAVKVDCRSSVTTNIMSNGNGNGNGGSGGGN